MAATTIPKIHWETIIETIYKGSCVPFLGAGVNVHGPDNRDGLPLGGEVALRLLESMLETNRKFSDLKNVINHRNLKEYKDRTEMALNSLEEIMPSAQLQSVRGRFNKILQSILPDNEREEKLAHIIFDEALEKYKELTRIGFQDLARVSLRYRINKDLPGFISKLKEIIPDTERKPSPLLKTLSHLPFKLIVTTNYDRLMERAFELYDKSEIIDPKIITVILKNGGTHTAKIIRKCLSYKMEQSIENYYAEVVGKYDPAGPFLCLQPEAWADELNRIMQETRLYLLDNIAFAARDLTDDVFNEIDDLPPSNSLVVRNRELIEEAFPGAIKRKKAYELLVQSIEVVSGLQENNIRKTLSQSQGVILYKLHGSFSDADGEQSPVVITEEDYIEFLTYIGATGQGIDNQITDKIKTSTLLFLGYSLEDWNFRTLFKGLVEKLTIQKQRISFAIQKDPSEFWVKFWEAKNVRIFNVDLQEFAEELEERFDAYYKAEKSKQDERDEATRRRREERILTRRGQRQ